MADYYGKWKAERVWSGPGWMTAQEEFVEPHDLGLPAGSRFARRYPFGRGWPELNLGTIA